MAPSLRDMSGRASVLGCGIDRLDFSQTLDRCEEIIRSGTTGQHMAINAAKIVSLQGDPGLREAVSQSELVTADGQAIVWASRILGDPLPERVAGIDLMFSLFGLAASKGYRVFILGARRDVLNAAVLELRTRFPGLEIAGTRDGYFSADEESAVVEEIERSRPHMLFVAISSPRKEYFLGSHREKLGVPFVMGVGGAIDVAAGITRRAPVPMQRAGLEWLFRLGQEPRRLLPRYLVTNTRFIVLVARAALRQRLLKR